jgi:hypothetical protein
MIDDIIRSFPSEEVQELLCILGMLDGPASCFADSTNGRLVIYDHHRRVRNILYENQADGIFRKIEFTFFKLDTSDPYRFNLEDIYFSCFVIAWKDVDGKRMIWSERTWKAQRPPSEYLDVYSIYENAWDRLSRVGENDLRPALTA